jgi:dienelactone hydrolase
VEVELWPEAADTPQRERETRSQPHGHRFVRNVTRPTLTPFVPEGARLAAIVCPGGGFRFLTMDNEGTALAEWLAARGVAAYVLKYRTVETPADDAEFGAQFRQAMATPREERERAMAEVTARILPDAVADARQAVDVVRREHERVGMVGFSAGARVTVAAALEGGLAFAAAIYGAAAGGDVTPPADAPPLFLAVAADDPVVRADDCIRLYKAWPNAELHVFACGGHGFGMRRQGLPSDAWLELFGAWLDSECA